MELLRNGAAGEDVEDLPYADCVKRGFRQKIQDRLPGRGEGEIPAAGGALKAGGFAGEGTGDDPAYLQHFPGDGAVLVKLLNGDDLLVSG